MTTEQNKPKMTDFEHNILWRFVAPLALTCIIGAGGSIFATARMSVAVENLQVAQRNNASKEWVRNKLNVLQFQTQSNTSRINKNEQRIQHNRSLMDQHSHIDDSLLMLPWFTPGQPRTPAARYAKYQLTDNPA